MTPAVEPSKRSRVHTAMRKLWIGAPGSLTLAVAALFLWASSNGVDCYPDCTIWQDLIRYLWLAAVLLFVVTTLAALVMMALRLFRRGGRADLR